MQFCTVRCRTSIACFSSALKFYIFLNILFYMIHAPGVFYLNTRIIKQTCIRISLIRFKHSVTRKKKVLKLCGRRYDDSHFLYFNLNKNEKTRFWNKLDIVRSKSHDWKAIYLRTSYIITVGDKSVFVLT